jgi:hypothetical protein
MCEIVDIVPVSTEQALGDDQEQLFEEEEDFAVAEEGKWSSPPVKRPEFPRTETRLSAPP